MLRAQPARLLATDKTAPGARLILLGREDATVGSAEGRTLQLSASGVADRHALIRRARGRYYLVDLGGTRINGGAARRRYRLKHGDQLSFGKAAPYRFIDPDGAKRLRNRRIIRAGAIATVVAFAVAVHLAGWDGGALSPTSIAGFLRSNLPFKEYLAPRTVVAKSTEPVARAAARPLATKAGPIEPAGTRPAAVKLEPATSASTNSASSRPNAAPSPSAAAWLERLNYYRAMAGVPALKEDPKLSASVAAHAHYLMVNFGGKIRAGEPFDASDHDEDPSKPGYSADGNSAAANAQIAWGCGPHDLSTQIDQWIAAPLNRFAMLNPLIGEAGFGEAYDDGCWAAGLRLPPGPKEVKPYPYAVEFPPAGATVSLRWNGMESPDPLTACPGYSAPVGLPITLQLGYLIDPKLGAYSLSQNGRVVKSCAYDAHGYDNPIPTAQEYGRWALRQAGAVVVIPRAPLESGAQYSVSITAHGHVYEWSFHAAQ